MTELEYIEKELRKSKLFLKRAEAKPNHTEEEVQNLKNRISVLEHMEELNGFYN